MFVPFIEFLFHPSWTGFSELSWYNRAAVCTLVALVIHKIAEWIIELSLRPLAKRADELKDKLAEAKVQLTAAGKDGVKDNPYEKMLEEAREEYTSQWKQCNKTTTIIGAILFLIVVVITFKLL